MHPQLAINPSSSFSEETGNYCFLPLIFRQSFWRNWMRKGIEVSSSSIILEMGLFWYLYFFLPNVLFAAFFKQKIRLKISSNDERISPPMNGKATNAAREKFTFLSRSHRKTFFLSLSPYSSRCNLPSRWNEARMSPNKITLNIILTPATSGLLSKKNINVCIFFLEFHGKSSAFCHYFLAFSLVSSFLPPLPPCKHVR